MRLLEYKLAHSPEEVCFFIYASEESTAGWNLLFPNAKKFEFNPYKILEKQETY